MKQTTMSNKFKICKIVTIIPQEILEISPLTMLVILIYTNIQNLNTPYILLEVFQYFLDSDKDKTLFVFYLHTRSINKGFGRFLKLFLSNLNFSISIICFSEIWLNDSIVDNSKYELPNYVSVRQIRIRYKGGGVAVYIHKNLKFKNQK